MTKVMKAAQEALGSSRVLDGSPDYASTSRVGSGRDGEYSGSRNERNAALNRGKSSSSKEAVKSSRSSSSAVSSSSSSSLLPQGAVDDGTRPSQAAEVSCHFISPITLDRQQQSEEEAVAVTAVDVATSATAAVPAAAAMAAAAARAAEVHSTSISPITPNPLQHSNQAAVAVTAVDVITSAAAVAVTPHREAEVGSSCISDVLPANRSRSSGNSSPSSSSSSSSSGSWDTFAYEAVSIPATTTTANAAAVGNDKVAVGAVKQPRTIAAGAAVASGCIPPYKSTLRHMTLSIKVRSGTCGLKGFRLKGFRG